MGVLADFYVSSDDTAVRYDEDQKAAEGEVIQGKRITPLEVSTLWAILRGIEWDASMMDELPTVLVRDGGERLIHKLPAGLVESLAEASAKALTEAAAAWAATEELACAPEDLQPFLQELQTLARRAQATERGMFLWNCV